MWHSFVEDPPASSSSEQQLNAGLRAAVLAGSLERTMWYYAHGANINNSTYDSSSSGKSTDSVLVAALQANNTALVSFLLLNGADWTAATAALSHSDVSASEELRGIVDDVANMHY
jgi:hypothetical protein